MPGFQRNVPFAPYTSLKIGGPAEYFFEAKSREELIDALSEARRQGLPVTVVSGGTNVLISDAGIKGLVVLMRLRGIQRDGERLIVEPGTPVGEIVAKSVQEGLAGLAWAGGLPGTVGGALYGNAGTFDHDIGEVTENVEIVDRDGALKVLPAEACRFRYRTSAFKEELRGSVIVQARLLLKPGDSKALREEMMGAIHWRKEHQPATNTAGSFFRNPLRPEGLHIPLEKVSGQGAEETIPVGWLIEELGLKGERVGGAYVSEKHANFLMNDGSATAADFIALVTRIKERVHERFGIGLEEEVRMLGFSNPIPSASK